MTKFLNKKQVKDLKSKKWELIDNKSGCVWFGADFDEHDKNGVLRVLSEQSGLNLSNDNDVIGYNFLIIGYSEERIGEE